nr:12221_t:CDS:10 [Entrophospora candida]
MIDDDNEEIQVDNQDEQNSDDNNINSNKNEMSDKELERLICEISEKFSDSKLDSKSHDFVESTSSIISPNQKFLTIDTRLLDADGEMKRMFSSSIVDGEIRSRNYARAVKKTYLAKPRQTWPPIVKAGLGMELLKDKEEEKENKEKNDGICYFKFTHSNQYQSVQSLFLQCVATHDPNTIYAVLRDNPYHIDSLLQMSEIYKMSGDHTMAAEFIERALYAFEKSFHIKFNISKGKVRLFYDQYENRRGCWQTAFEFSKLLLALDPINDPICTLHYIDFLGLKARQYSYVLSITDEWNNHKYFIASKLHKISSAMLEKAILKFPSVVLPLAEKCEINLDSDLTDSPYLHEIPTSNCLNLLIEMYVDQVHPLWTQPEVISWFQTAVTNVVVKLQIPTYKGCLSDKEFSDTFIYGDNVRQNHFTNSIPLDLCRYLVISENSKFFKYIPDVISSEVQSHDPLPPPNSTSSYNNINNSQNSSSDSSSSSTGTTVDLLQYLDIAPNRGDLRTLADRINQIAEATNLQAVAGRLMEMILGSNHNNNGDYGDDEGGNGDNNNVNNEQQQQQEDDSVEYQQMPGVFPQNDDNQDEDSDSI